MRLKPNTLNFIVIFATASLIWAGLLSEPIPVLILSIFIGKEAADNDCQQIWDWVLTTRLTDLLLVVISFMQWYVYRRQALILERQTGTQDRQTAISAEQTDLMAKQKEIMRQAHMIAYRPRIMIRGLELITTFPNIIIRYSLVNCGQNDAFSIFWQTGVRVVTPETRITERVPTEKPINPHPIELRLSSGQHYQWDESHSLGLNEAGLDEVNCGAKVLMFFGRISYKDGLKNHRITGFVRRYNPGTFCFDLTGDPDGEYQD